MKSKIKILVASFLLLTIAVPASADIVFCGGRNEPACTAADLFGLIFLIVNYLISMAGIVALFFVVWGGVRMVLSRGNPAAVTEAKSTIWFAILGFILVLLSYMIVSYIIGLLLPGVDVSNPLNTIKNYLPTP